MISTIPGFPLQRWIPETSPVPDKIPVVRVIEFRSVTIQKDELGTLIVHVSMDIVLACNSCTPTVVKHPDGAAG